MVTWVLLGVGIANLHDIKLVPTFLLLFSPLHCLLTSHRNECGILLPFVPGMCPRQGLRSGTKTVAVTYPFEKRRHIWDTSRLTTTVCCEYSKSNRTQKQQYIHEVQSHTVAQSSNDTRDKMQSGLVTRRMQAFWPSDWLLHLTLNRIFTHYHNIT